VGVIALLSAKNKGGGGVSQVRKTHSGDSKRQGGGQKIRRDTMGTEVKKVRYA